MAERIELVFGIGASFHFPHLVIGKFWYLENCGHLPLPLSETLDLENFPIARGCCYQQNSSTVELVDHTYDDGLVIVGRIIVYYNVGPL